MAEKKKHENEQLWIGVAGGSLGGAPGFKGGGRGGDAGCFEKHPSQKAHNRSESLVTGGTYTPWLWSLSPDPLTQNRTTFWLQRIFLTKIQLYLC